MRRIMLLLAVMALLVLALAMPAVAKNVKVDLDPETGEPVEVQTGQPLFSGNPLQGNVVGHCGALGELIDEDIHGAAPFQSAAYNRGFTCR